MKLLILGNIIGFFGSILMVLCGYVKNRKKAILIQTIQIILLSISDLILGSITGFIINTISILRNILSYNNKLNKFFIILIIVVSILLTILFNNMGLIGYLPLINTIIFTCLMNIKDNKKFKYLLIFSTTLWLIHDIYIKAYTTAIFDLLTILASIIAIIKMKKRN